MGTLISIRGLINQFGKQRVHDGLDLDINQNEVLGIVGGSGSGKSVLLRTMLGLNRPFAGEIQFDGQDMTQLSAPALVALKRQWGVMFQRGALFSSLTVADNILFPLREFSGLTAAECAALMRIRLQMVGLKPEVATQYPAELSGGMVKRVALARALALDPVVLFLDEPTSGLDPVSAGEFDHLILDLQRILGLTVIMVTHDLDSLFSTCDRIAMLVDKRVIVGTRDELLAHPHPEIRHYFGGVRAHNRLAGQRPG